MRNAMKVAALSLLVVVTLAGCFKAKVDLTLSSDDTISGTMLVALQSGIGESLGGSDEEILGQLTEGLGGDLDGATVEDYSEEGYIGKVFSFKDQPLDAFSSGEDGEDISITREGDLFIVDGTWNTDDAGTEGMDPATLGAEFTFAVTFPGKVTDSNGTVSNDGHTVTWDLFGGPDTLHAEGKATADSNGWMLWALLGVVALLIVAAVIITAVVVRKRAAAPVAVPEAPAYEAMAPVDFAPAAVAPTEVAPTEVAPAETPASAPVETPAEAEVEPESPTDAPTDEQPK